MNEFINQLETVLTDQWRDLIEIERVEEALAGQQSDLADEKREVKEAIVRTEQMLVSLGEEVKER